MTDPILLFDPERTTNALAIAGAGALGYLDGHVLDLTVGPEAGFWTKWQPDRLTTNDLDPAVPADHHHDARATPFPDRSFDSGVWDPPYGYRGTSRLASDRRYGLAGAYRTPDQIDALLLYGTLELLRLVRHFALVKCMNQRVNGKPRRQRDWLISEAEKTGASYVDELHRTGNQYGQH